jgi:hypothetical protein
MIDQHLAFSLDHDAHSLRSQMSRGTLFVDYDGTDAPIIHYRHHSVTASDPRRDSMFGSPPQSRSADAHSPQYTPVRVPSTPLIHSLELRRSVYMDGDRSTGFESRYDGGMARGRRDGRAAAVVLGDGEVDARACVREGEVLRQGLRQGKGLELELELERERERRRHRHSSRRHEQRSSSRCRSRRRHAGSSNVQFKTWDLHKELPPPPADREMSKKGRVANFIARLLETMACLGLLEHGDTHGEYG